MCGIAGFYCEKGVFSNSEFIIQNMLGEIIHRGPDEAGYYVDDSLAMGTVRLSVVDLRSGSQPICDASDRYWICFNGEIYNHKELRGTLKARGYCFKTDSDTEVALYAYIHWKKDALEKFNGAFAFVVYDSLENTFFAGRDRFGKRPFYYSFQNGSLLFASEVKAFKQVPGFQFEFDVSQLISMSTIWTPLPDSSCFENIHQLPHGGYLSVSESNLEVGSWISSPPSGPDCIDVHLSEALDDVRGVLEESVKCRMDSDVEVGVYLSGGLDSSIVSLLASKYSECKLRTFSVAFEDGSFDESVDQKLVVDSLGVKNERVSVSYRDIANNMSEAVYHAEVPAFRTAFVPMYLLSKLAASEGIKVVLTGEGADEAFLGYDIFRETLLRLSWWDLAVSERKTRLLNLNRFLGHYNQSNIQTLYGIYEKSLDVDNREIFSHSMRFQNGRFVSRLFMEKEGFCVKLLDYIGKDEHFSRLSPIGKAQWLEYETLLAGYLLSTQGDRMSMAHGVENRCPFLDYNVVQMAKKYNLLFDDGSEEKKLLKMAFLDHLPPQISKKQKFPFRAPDSVALLAGASDSLEMTFSAHERNKLAFLDPQFTKSLVNKVRSSNGRDLSPKEDQAFVFLHSLLILGDRFVRGGHSFDRLKYKKIMKIMSKKIVRKRKSV